MASAKVEPLEVVISRIMLAINRLTIWLIAGYATLFLSCAIIFLMQHGKSSTLIVVTAFAALGLIIAIVSSVKLAVLHFRMINAFSRNELGRIRKIRADHQNCACWCKIMRDKRSTVSVFLHQHEIRALARAVEHFAKHNVVIAYDD